MRRVMLGIVILVFALAACEDNSVEKRTQELFAVAMYARNAENQCELMDIGLGYYTVLARRYNSGEYTLSQAYTRSVELRDEAEEMLAAHREARYPQKGLTDEMVDRIAGAHILIRDAMMLRVEGWETLGKWFDDQKPSLQHEFESKLAKSQDMMDEAVDVLRQVVKDLGM